MFFEAVDWIFLASICVLCIIYDHLRQIPFQFYAFIFRFSKYTWTSLHTFPTRLSFNELSDDLSLHYLQVPPAKPLGEGEVGAREGA